MRSDWMTWSSRWEAGKLPGVEASGGGMQSLCYKRTEKGLPFAGLLPYFSLVLKRISSSLAQSPSTEICIS